MFGHERQVCASSSAVPASVQLSAHHDPRTTTLYHRAEIAEYGTLLVNDHREIAADTVIQQINSMYNIVQVPLQSDNRAIPRANASQRGSRSTSARHRRQREMQLVFRTDTSVDISGGYAMRYLARAKRSCQSCAKRIFTSPDRRSNITKMVGRGVEPLTLPYEVRPAHELADGQGLAGFYYRLQKQVVWDHCSFTN